MKHRRPCCSPPYRLIGCNPWESDADAQVITGKATIWTYRGIWLGLIAFAMTAVGEAWLFPDDKRGLGVVLLVLGAVVGVGAWNGARSQPEVWGSKGKAWRQIALRRMLFLRLFGVGAAILLSIISITTYLSNPTAIFGLQGVLWLASMALLLFSCARWYPRGSGVGAETTLWTRSEVLLFAGLVVLSLFTHLAYLDELPWRLHFDEGFAYIEVMRFYRGPAISLFNTTWEGTSLPSLWFGFAGLLMQITGPTLVGVRLGVALAGALTVMPVYGIARLLGSRWLAALAAFAVSVSAAYVHYSRVSIINMTTPLAWACCFYFLLKGLRSRRPGDFVWAGLSAGLSIYTYYGTRLLPYLLLVFLVYLMLFHFRASRERLGHYALVGAGFLAGCGPLVGYFMLNPRMWAGRGLSTLNVPAVIPTTWDGIVADWNVLAPISWQNFLGLSVLPGKDTVYYAPFLLPAEAALLVLGTGILVWRWRQPSAFLMLLWGLGVVLTGGTLLDASTVPNFAHWTPAFPVFYLALALPLALWWGAVMRVERRYLKIAGGVLLVIALALDAGANAYAYIVQYPPKVPGDHSTEAAQGRFVEGIEPNTHVRLVGNSWGWVPLNEPIDEMMASHGTTLTRFLSPSRELPTVGEPGRNMAFLFYNDMFGYLPLVESYYPGGRVGELRSPDGVLIAQSYFVPASVAASRYGVMATVKSEAAESVPAWSGQVPGIGALPEGINFSYPLTAAWSGAIYVRDPGRELFSVEGGENARLWVQGEPVQPRAPLSVEPGWVRFSMSVRLATAGPVKLLLQDSSSPAAEIDSTRIWPAPLEQGLAITLQGTFVTHRIDPFVGAGLLNSGRAVGPGSDPDGLPMGTFFLVSSQIRMEGELNSLQGSYLMEIRSDANVQLTIDGTPIVKMCATTGSQSGAGAAQLTAGWHHVQIDFQAGGGPTNRLEWFWTRPDGVKEVVPPSALRIAPQVSPSKSVVWPDPPAPVTCP